MATTENLHTGDASKTKFSFTFPYIQEADVAVYLFDTDAWVLKTLTTHYTFANATTIQFVSAPAAATSDEQTALGDTNNIKIKRTTDADSLPGTFYPGSAIRSTDLNDNFTQNLYVTQEAINNVTEALADAVDAVADADAAVATANDAADDVKRWVKDGDGTDTAGDEDDDVFADRPLKPQGVPYAVAQAAAAVTTANTASTTASSAVTTANTASTNASAAVTTANNASAAVSDAVIYTLKDDKAAFEATTYSEDDYFEITDSTGISDSYTSFTDGGSTSMTVSGIPSAPTFDDGIATRFSYDHSTTTFTWVGYWVTDSETRYAPSVSPDFTGDATLAGDLTINTDAFFVDASAKEVGIGTASPTYPLTIQSNSDAEAISVLGRSADDISSTMFYENDGATQIGRLQARQSYFQISGTNNSEGVYIDNSGNVGIGKSNPSTLLDVDGTVTAPTINASTALQIGGVAVTSTAAELNYSDGVTSNVQTQLDAKQASDADLTALSSCQTGAATALALLTATEVGVLDGVTSTTAELNILDGVTSTTAELNYSDGVTSNIQTQIDNLSTSPAFTGDVSIEDKIIHTGDTNTAIRFPSADTITAETDGSERLRIDSDGNLGIGLAITDNFGTDHRVVQIHSGSTANSYLSLTNTTTGDQGAGAGLNIIQYGDETMINNRSDGYMSFATNNVEQMRIDSSGNVGLGTSSPLYPLHIATAMSSSPSYIMMEVTGSNTVGGGGGIAFDASTNTESNNGKFLATIAGIRNSDSNGSIDLVFSTSKSGVNSSLPVEKLRLDSDGDATFAGDIIVSGTVDGRDVATDGTKLDGITTSANYSRILQVKQTVKSSSFSSITQGSYVAITGLSVDITPASSSNKILIMAEVSGSNSNNYGQFYHIYRDGSQITPDGPDNSNTPDHSYTTWQSPGDTRAMYHAHTLIYLDSPGTDSSVTYQIYGAKPSASAGSVGVEINPYGSSNITVMEVAV